jgi:hypothetical protein
MRELVLSLSCVLTVLALGLVFMLVGQILVRELVDTH